MYSVDGKEGQVRLLFGIAEEIDVDQLLNFNVRGGYILNDRGEERETGLRTVHHLGPQRQLPY